MAPDDGLPRARLRARDLGLSPGRGAPGPLNAITDVGGVRVGHATLYSGEAEAAVRTGVTAVIPHDGDAFREKVPAAVHVINGFGKAAGLSQVGELGVLETPIVLTNTLAVGVGFDGLVEHALQSNEEICRTTGSVNPVVVECNDWLLNDIRGRHVRVEHVLEAIGAASTGLPAEGAVGAGTGMVSFGWKGGIGTASRAVDGVAGGAVVGALVLANFGRPEDLTVCGVPVGGLLRAEGPGTGPAGAGGSCVVVLATDAPLGARQLGRLARRAQSGLARTGGISEHGSGEYALAFSTAVRIPHWPDEDVVPTRELREDGPLVDALFVATEEAVEEAILNALFTAETVSGLDGFTARALPVEVVLGAVRTGGGRP